ncbi:uncharacterized protein LOC143880052 [Tasmannia lanceolata]|uniref:uncharacterized protein LOC143880052 n=1 Tax=Tasmannia lanceolata TaxID=3420 RepID=UPI004063FE9A
MHTMTVSMPFILSLLFPAFLHSQALPRFLLNNSTDQGALLSFKSNITDDPFQVLENWNPNISFCNWNGVLCNMHKQRVTGLSLGNLMLAGTISPQITNLTFLRLLDLQNNSLHGSLPPRFGRLFRLETVILASNLIHGVIPSSLSLCSRLQVIDFSNNKLEGTIPTGLGTLSKLRDLSFAKNNLTGSIPSSFGNLSSLNNMILFSNNLQGPIPVELGRLQNLLQIHVGDNKIVGDIPSSLFNISSLQFFSLAENQLSGHLPWDMFSTLYNLNTFFVGGNMLEGPIPDSLSNASSLERLDLSTNGFIGQIPMLGNLPNIHILNLEINQLVSNGENGYLTSLTNSTLLRVFSVATNQLNGRLPSSIGNLSSQLSLLLMGENQFEGNIPEEIGSLGNLTLFSLAANSFTGHIPSTIGKLKNLQNLFIDVNLLSGQIPESLGNLTKLYQLGLSSNNLTGKIPSSLSNCQHLQMLDLSLNRLDGAIPKEILGYSNLGNLLNLSWNSLSGPLPIEIGNLKMVQGIDFSENYLSGTIPVMIGECLNLFYLSLAGNSFQGPIPDSLAGLKGIEYIDLSSNNLSGMIPKSLCSLQFLQSLNLSNNHLQGQVPKSGIFANSSAVSLTGNAELCDGVSKLHLPVCATPEKEKHSDRSKAKLIIWLTVGSAALVFLLGCTFLLLWNRKSHKPTATDVISFEGPHRLYSYYDIRTATNNFSSGNLIGEGSFGSVYKGVFRDGTLAAIKVFNMEQHGASKSFIAECETLRNVRHRNLVRIMSACSGGEFKALVLNFMPNGSLEKWLYEISESRGRERRYLDLRQRLQIAIDVASGLEYLHHDCETPIVHCDLKPSNVLLDEDMTAVVSDFGLSRMLLQKSTTQHLSSTLGLKGSIGYIAPEYGLGGGASAKGDVYSYGILLIEMFTRKRPTDEIFVNGLDIKKWVANALPDQVMEILDMDLMEGHMNRREDCLVSLLTIGLSCTSEMPEERPDMRNVSSMIKSTRNRLCNNAN